MIENSYTRKVGVIGTGLVGTSFAYALMQRGLASDLVLIDNNSEKAIGFDTDENYSRRLS